MTTIEQVQDLVDVLGLGMATHVPITGKGRRYAIGYLIHGGQGVKPLFKCTGATTAMTWLEGFKAGMITQRARGADSDCENCNGIGFVLLPSSDEWKRCPKCNGTGEKEK